MQVEISFFVCHFPPLSTIYHSFGCMASFISDTTYKALLQFVVLINLYLIVSMTFISDYWSSKVSFEFYLLCLHGVMYVANADTMRRRRRVLTIMWLSISWSTFLLILPSSSSTAWTSRFVFGCRSWRAMSATITPPPTPEKPWIFLPDIQLVEHSVCHLHIPSTVFGDHRFVTSHVIDGSHDRFLLLSRVRRFKA